MIRVTYNDGFGFTARLYESLPAAMEDVDHKAEECNWTVHEIQEVWR